MQWVLIWALFNNNAISTGSQVFYSKETCEIARGLVEDKLDGSWHTVKAVCAARTVDQNGAITLDK